MNHNLRQLKKKTIPTEDTLFYYGHFGLFFNYVKKNQ